jgi:chemotaxis protein histidine kinase CheA
MGVTVTLNLSELISNLNPSDRSDIIQAMACEDDIVRHVAETLALGSTDNGSSGPRATRGLQASPYAIDAAKAYLAMQAGEIAQAEIARLRNLLSTCESRLEDTQNRLSKLERSWDLQVRDFEDKLRRANQTNRHLQNELSEARDANRRILGGGSP